ncbi:unnamed protein product, partial [Rhizoctonia solani]
MSFRKLLKVRSTHTLEEYEMHQSSGAGAQPALNTPLDHTSRSTPATAPSAGDTLGLVPANLNTERADPVGGFERAVADTNITAEGPNPQTSTNRKAAKLKDEWSPVETFYRTVDESSTSSTPLIKAMVSDFIGVIEKYENFRDDINSSFRQLTQRHERLESLALTGSIESICKSIQRSLQLTQDNKKRSTMKRYLKIGREPDTKSHGNRRVLGDFQRLVLNLDFDLWKIDNEQFVVTLLNHLRPSVPARYNHGHLPTTERAGCTPGTREDVLNRIAKWTEDVGTTSLYWLNGMAGTGKTTIAYSVCAELDEERRLVASFFCSRSIPECRDVGRIMPTIAYQLAEFSWPFRSMLSRALQRNPDLLKRSMEDQLEHLIIRPLVQVQETLAESLVIVIDALDECEDYDGTGRILEVLLANTKTAYLPVKFILTSRPEPEITDHMEKQKGKRAKDRLILHELDIGLVREDIKKYLTMALEPILPTNAEVNALMERAGTLFIYAATIVRYISHNNFQSDPRRRLENIINVPNTPGSAHNRAIDELYDGILTLALDKSKRNQQQEEVILDILGIVVYSREQLTVDNISTLLEFDNTYRLHEALRPLSSVLHVNQQNKLVTILHASFSDCLTDSSRSKYFCDPQKYHSQLARRCFKLIETTPRKFNICELESSYVLDSQVPDLGRRVEMSIPRELRYACRHWAYHLAEVNDLAELTVITKEFFSKRLLLWMEVMNLTNYMHEGANIIHQAGTWLRPEREGVTQNITDLAHDAWRFVSGYASSPGLQSTPHIYTSALALWSPSTPVGQHYRLQASGLLTTGPPPNKYLEKSLGMGQLPGGVRMAVWSPNNQRVAVINKDRLFILDALNCENIIDSVGSRGLVFSSVAYSYDGAQIACGFLDGTISTWNERRNRKIAISFKGHTKLITSIQYSSDGKCIVSGSWDKTLRIYDTKNGSLLYNPLSGHTGKVNSVAYSSDNNYIVSASRDHTMRIWDAKTGNCILPVFRGHTGSVNSARYSPDNTKIVSGSSDNTVRIWDALTGKILKTFTGHTSSVQSVGYSPDGGHVVSGSWDETVRTWNIGSEEQKSKSFIGHSHWVLSVQYSPDGTRIASASWDGTVHIWDSHEDQTSTDPEVEQAAMKLPQTTSIHESPEPETNGHHIGVHNLPGEHSGTVLSVDFSPDGASIVSGSQDNTLRIWNTRTGKPMSPALKEHTDEVHAVKYSPNGSQIASGSSDHTIILWDTDTNHPILHPLEGHTNEILSLAYTPDGNHLISGSRDKTIRIWDLQSRRSTRILLGHTDVVTSVGCSHRGNLALSGSGDQTIRVWDIKTGQPELLPLKGHSDWIMSIDCSPTHNMHFVSGSADKTVCVWDITTRKPRFGLLRGHSDYVNSVKYSPTGTHIVSGSDDGTICIWDASTGNLMFRPPQRHIGWVKAVGFSPTGREVASGSQDKTIRIWDSQALCPTSKVHFPNINTS